MATTKGRHTLGIGGGRGGYDLLQMFSGSNNVDIRFVVDPSDEAQGVQMARELGITTLTDTETALVPVPYH